MLSRGFAVLTGLCVSAAILGLGWYAGLVNPVLEYRPAAFTQLELWRLLTAHVAHLNLTHAILNLLGLGLIVFWLGDQRRPLAWCAAALFIALGISVGLYIWQPDVDYYVGLSGVLHGLLVFGLAPLCAKNHPVGWATILALIIKLCYERIIPGGNSATEVLIAGPVLSIAHVYGACIGAALSFIWVLWQTLQQRPRGQSEGAAAAATAVQAPNDQTDKKYGRAENPGTADT